MGMATLQLYKNKYQYPHYSETLTPFGLPKECTPRGINLRSGQISLDCDIDDMMGCNYLSIDIDGRRIYGWIDDAIFQTERHYLITYTVDAFRTYLPRIDLGTQYIDRRPTATSQRDPLLGAEQDYPDVMSYEISTAGASKRIFVVQVRPASGESYSATPLQPNPYQFFMVDYDPQNWMDCVPIQQLLTQLEGGAEPTNLVTMYSIPWMDTSGLLQRSLPVTVNDVTTDIAGWYMLNNVNDSYNKLKMETPIHFNNVDKNALLRVNHAIQLVIPDAGIISIPDELFMRSDLSLRQDIDLLSGASNYMLMTGSTQSGTAKYYTQSARGSSVSSIPILSDPMDTYLSQNQNALTTSLMGDIATMAVSAAMFTPQGRAIGTAMGLGAGMSTGAGVLGIYSGVNNMIDRHASKMDAGNRYSNPPAYLGTALGGAFVGKFWVVITSDPVDNADDVHNNFGYQYGKVTALTLPTAGYIKTEGCNVMAKTGDVPRWAMAEVNTILDNGLQVH